MSLMITFGFASTRLLRSPALASASAARLSMAAQKQPQRKPPPHYRRRHIAGRCRLPYREDGAVLNLLAPARHER